MNISTESIMAYIDYLKSIGFTITLHGDVVRESEMIKYNFHHNPYCHYVKTVYCLWNTCIKRQCKVIEKCKSGPFFGSCYAGVGEFVYPIKSDETVIGFISVSGYISPESEEKAMHFAKKNGLPQKKISELLLRHLCDAPPSRETVDAVITPLVFMLESHFEKQGMAKVDMIDDILRYIAENCHSKITVADIAARFNYSVSTISHMLVKKTGKSLPEHLDELRMNEAVWYLTHSKMSIAEISAFLGYCSSNYFSYAFKKRFGKSPKSLRKG